MILLRSLQEDWPNFLSRSRESCKKSFLWVIFFLECEKLRWKFPRLSPVPKSVQLVSRQVEVSISSNDNGNHRHSHLFGSRHLLQVPTGGCFFWGNRFSVIFELLSPQPFSLLFFSSGTRRKNKRDERWFQPRPLTPPPTPNPRRYL